MLGPREGHSLPDVPDDEGCAPDTYVPQFIQTDNAAYGEAVAAYGVPLLLAEEIDADPPGTDERAGGATNSTFDPPLSYRWTTTGSRDTQQQGFVTTASATSTPTAHQSSTTSNAPSRPPAAHPSPSSSSPGARFEALLATGWTSGAAEMRLDCRIVVEPR